MLKFTGLNMSPSINELMYWFFKIKHEYVFVSYIFCFCFKVAQLKSTIKEDVSMLNMVTLNSLAPGKPGCLFKTAIFNLVLLIGIFTLSNNNALGWMAWHLTDDKSTLVQVMAWCRQATSHYLSQCWPSSMSPYGVTRPQWVKQLGIFFQVVFQCGSL